MTLKTALLAGFVFAAGLLMPGLLFAQAVGGGGQGGGGGLIRFAMNPGCKEGQRGIFTEPEPGGERSRQVVRVCHNGSYYDLSGYIYDPQPRCFKEGEIRRTDQYAFQCIQGRWIRFSE